MTHLATSSRSHRRGRQLVAGMIVAALTVIGSTACSSDDASDGTADSPSTSATAGPSAGAALEVLDVDAFADRLDDGGDQVVINVHIPYEGEIDGTDLFLPFDTILEEADLPEDRATPLLLYCRSGRMSEEAGEALVDAGYTDVAHLDGGMVAWDAAGRTVEQRPQG